MCYSALLKADLNQLAQRFGALVAEDIYRRLYESVKSDPKKFKIPGADQRIFPKYYAPIIYRDGSETKIQPLRYSTFPAPKYAQQARYTSFNARRDNLSSDFWNNAFQKHHGLIVIAGFYEWVRVSDLLKAGVVTIDAVKANFDEQSELRKQKILSQNKPYKPTKTELKDPRFRDIIIQFSTTACPDLLVPVIFNREENWEDCGFAMVTDEPNPEVRAAGHDRTPICLTREASQAWLDSASMSAREIQNILDQKQTLVFSHELADVA